MSGEGNGENNLDGDDNELGLDEHFSSCESQVSPQDENKTTEMDNAERRGNDSDRKQNSMDSGDMFLQLLDIAVATKRAQSQAHCAQDKVNFIARLYECAKEEALGLHEVAESLAKTAASVAVIALQICQYKSYSEAFRSKPDYSERISLEEFMKIIKPETKEAYRMEAPTYPRRFSSSTSETEASDFVTVTGPNMPKLRTPQYEKPQTSIPNADPSISESRRIGGGFLYSASAKGSLGSKVYDENNSDLKPGKGARKTSLPNPQLSHVPSNLYQTLIDNEQILQLLSGSGSSHSRLAANEPFPSQKNLSDMRESLASTFDSSSNLTPLWEDRYVPPGKIVTPPVLNREQSWVDKKQFKQFQMKLQNTLNSPPGSNITCESPDLTDDYVTLVEPPNICVELPTPEETTSRKSPRQRQRARTEMDDASSSDSELDEFLSDKRPVLLIKKFDKKEVASHNLQPPAAHNRSISPLLSNSEKDHVKEKPHTYPSPKLPVKQSFQPHWTYSSSEGSRSPGRDDDV